MRRPLRAEYDTFTGKRVRSPDAATPEYPILAGMSSGAPEAIAPVRRDQTSLRDAALSALAHDPALPLPGSGRTLDRWRALARIAAQDVCLVKVLEAHHDAIAILAELGASPVHDHGLMAVWAAEPPDAKLAFSPRGQDWGTLEGTKAWCSGANLVQSALVTAHHGEQTVLAYVRLDQAGITLHDDAWSAVGMARVVSGRVRFEGVRAALVGAPGSYLSRPGFWHGGGGIAACWFGAACAIAETLRVHPRIARDPHAAMHLGAVDMVLTASTCVLRDVAARIDDRPDEPHIDAVTRVRSFVERACTEVIDRVGRALGPAPLCEDRAHALRCADLTTFIRQSHAERDWAALGQAAARGDAPWTL